MKILWGIWCLTGFLFGTLKAQTEYLDSLYAQANRYYQEGDYGMAANTYDRIMRQGYAHVNLYYNLGNAYYQLGRLGEAIWAYEKGLEVKPRDPDLKFNLSVARARTLDRVEIPEPLFLLKWYGGLKRALSPRGWLNLTTGFFFVSGLFYSVSRFAKRRLRTSGLRTVAAGLLLTGLSGLLFADAYFDLSEKEEGIVVTREGRVFSAPTGTGSLLFVVHEGTKAEITGQQDGWAEIQLIDGKKGWISDDKLKKL
ncbi:MAG: tetratricopeptide repeat protein [Fidelibacterota bacterium]